jgi:hypothetical protein
MVLLEHWHLAPSLATASAPISPMLVAGCIVVTGGNEDVDHQNKGIQIESIGILNLNISDPIKHFLMDSY